VNNHLYLYLAACWVFALQDRWTK